MNSSPIGTAYSAGPRRANAHRFDPSTYSPFPTECTTEFRTRHLRHTLFVFSHTHTQGVLCRVWLERHTDAERERETRARRRVPRSQLGNKGPRPRPDEASEREREKRFASSPVDGLEAPRGDAHSVRVQERAHAYASSSSAIRGARRGSRNKRPPRERERERERKDTFGEFTRTRSRTAFHRLEKEAFPPLRERKRAVPLLFRASRERARKSPAGAGSSAAARRDAVGLSDLLL